VCAEERAVAEQSRLGAGRSVASKVVALASAFTPATPRLTLAELAAITGLPPSTAHRLATELVEWGGLERADGSGYRIGLRMWEIGSLAPRGESLRAAALPIMQDLHEGTRATVHLAIMEAREALYIEKITGRDAVRVKSRRGGRLPLHATGVGKILLAYSSDEVIDEVLAAGLRRYTARTIVAPGQLRRSLREARRTGLAYNFEELTPGSLTVAAPIFGPGGDAVAALDIVVRTSRANLRQLAPAVRTSAISISRALRAGVP
jgi:DNA-binding IclR family transcriptional regulator